MINASYFLKTDVHRDLVRGHGTTLTLLVFLYGLAFFSHFSIALGQLCLLGLVIAFVLTARARWCEVRKDPFVWLTLAFVAYVAVRAALALSERPEMAYEHLDGARRLLRSGLPAALAVAYGISRLRDPMFHAVGIVGALVLGLVTTSLIQYDWVHIAQDVGTRMTFGFGVISHAALALATLFITSMMLAACLLSWRPRNLIRLLGGSVSLLLAIASLVGLIQNQTRAVWIGLAIAIACGALYLCWTGLRKRRADAPLGATVLVILVALSATLFGSQIHARWSEVAPEVREGIIALSNGQAGPIEPGSIGDRIHWAVFGARLLSDRPILGYGPAESRYLRLERSDVPANIDDKSTHFHNGLLDLALRLGAIGVIILTCAAVWLFYAAPQWRKFSACPTQPFLSAFSISWLIVLGIHQAANHRFLDFNVAYMFAVIAGMAHAGWLVARWGVETETSAATSDVLKAGSGS